ncbi:MAG: tetratricopeptide repeat protein, partial [Phycisphaerales bacterium]
YAAPEQVSSDAQETDTRSDVYSLGVVLYELVAGTMPYDTAGPMESVVNAIAHAEPIPPRTDIFDRRVDADVTTIILKALSKAPDRRYQSAGALGADIARHLAGTVIEARRDSTWYVVRKTASRHKVLLAGAGVVALALLAGAGAAGYGLTRARDARAYEAVERVHAQSEARSARSAGRLVRQLFVPVDVITDEAELGRYVFAGRLRVWTTLKFGALADDPDGEATARSVFASEVLKQDPAAAEGFLRINIASLAKQHGENHPALAEAFHGLAEVLLGRGNRLIEAERSARRAVEIRRALLRGDDPGLAASQHLLARILLARGDAAGAADACEEAVAALRIAGKPNTLELAGAVATRSDIRSALGRAAEAEADAREALVLGLEALVDDDDPFVIECLLRSADLLGAASPTPPEPVLAAALQQPTRAGVADALRAAGHRLRIHGTSAADCLAHAAGLETILSIRTALFDKDDPSVARTAASIAADHYLAVDLPGVDAALRRLLPLLEARLGRDHVALIPAIESLCENLMDLEEFERAAASRRRMLDIWSAQSEPARDDLWLANEHRWLALALAFGGSFAEAEIEYRAAIDGLARAGLVDHYLGDICTGGLGWVALHLGRPDEAEALTRSALERYSSRSGAPRDQLALLQRHLGHVLIARGRLDEAAPLVDAAHASIGLTVGETAPLACTLIDAIELARRRGDVAAVERFCAELAEARRKIRGPSNVEPRAAEAE